MRCSLLFSVALTLGSLAPLQAQDVFCCTWGGTLYAVNSHTGERSFVGTSLSGMNALAMDDSGNLWSTHRDGNNTYHITSVDPATGQATIIASDPLRNILYISYGSGGVQTLDTTNDTLLGVTPVPGLVGTVEVSAEVESSAAKGNLTRLLAAIREDRHRIG